MWSRIIVIGASAGGFRALRTIFAALDPKLNASIFAVLHMSAAFPSYLAELFSKSSTLPVEFASTGEFKSGTIYIARPDHHLIVEHNTMRLSQGPKENSARPAIDVTFRSAAAAYRRRVIGVLLTGMLDDGTAGLFYVKRHGGLAIVQDPDDAEFASMPASALEHVKIDRKLPLKEIAQTINRLVALDLPGTESARQSHESDGIEGMIEQDRQRAVPTNYMCPACQGPLSRIEDGSPTRFRCRVGHGYGLKSLYDAQASYVENTLWSSFQALQAKARMEESLRREAEVKGDSVAVETWKRRIDETQRQIADFAPMLELSPSELAITSKSDA